MGIGPISCQQLRPSSFAASAALHSRVPVNQRAPSARKGSFLPNFILDRGILHTFMRFGTEEMRREYRNAEETGNLRVAKSSRLTMSTVRLRRYVRPFWSGEQAC